MTVTNESVASFGDCCSVCQATSQCIYYTFNPQTSTCWLFAGFTASPAASMPMPGFLSGSLTGLLPSTSKCLVQPSCGAGDQCHAHARCNLATGGCVQYTDVGALCSQVVGDAAVFGHCDATGQCNLCEGRVPPPSVPHECVDVAHGVCSTANGAWSFLALEGNTCTTASNTAGVCDFSGGCLPSGRRKLLACTPGDRLVKLASPSAPVFIRDAPCKTAKLAPFKMNGVDPSPGVSTDKEYMAKVVFSCTVHVRYECQKSPSTCLDDAFAEYVLVTRSVPPVNGISGTITGWMRTTDDAGASLITMPGDPSCAFTACRKVVSDKTLSGLFPIPIPFYASPCGTSDQVVVAVSGDYVRFTGDTSLSSCASSEPASTGWAYASDTTGQTGWIRRANLAPCDGCSTSSACNVLQPPAVTVGQHEFRVGSFPTPWLDDPGVSGSPTPVEVWQAAEKDFLSIPNASEWLYSLEGFATLQKIKLFLAAGALARPHSFQHLVYFLGGAKGFTWWIREGYTGTSAIPISQSLMYRLDFSAMILDSMGDSMRLPYQNMCADINALMEAAEQLSANPQYTQYKLADSWFGFTISDVHEVVCKADDMESSGISWDWASIGYYRTCATANVVVLDATLPRQHFTMNVVYTMRDIYDWHSSKYTIDLGMDKLAPRGLARVYAMEGAVKVRVDWYSGQRMGTTSPPQEFSYRPA